MKELWDNDYMQILRLKGPGAMYFNVEENLQLDQEKNKCQICLEKF